MSDNKDNKKQGFFSKLFGGSSSSNENNIQEKTPENKSEIPSKSALNNFMIFGVPSRRCLRGVLHKCHNENKKYNCP